MTTLPDTTPPDTQPDEQLPAWATPIVLETIQASLVEYGIADHGSQLSQDIAVDLNDAGLVITPDPEVRIEHYRDTAGDYRWRAIDTHNGLTIADSAEGYRTRSHAHHMATRLFPTATTTEV